MDHAERIRVAKIKLDSALDLLLLEHRQTAGRKLREAFELLGQIGVDIGLKDMPDDEMERMAERAKTAEARVVALEAENEALLKRCDFNSEQANIALNGIRAERDEARHQQEEHLAWLARQGYPQNTDGDPAEATVEIINDRDSARAERDCLRDAIAAHRAATTGHSSCWENDVALWRVVDAEATYPHGATPGRDEFLAACAAYHDGRCRTHG